MSQFETIFQVTDDDVDLEIWKLRDGQYSISVTDAYNGASKKFTREELLEMARQIIQKLDMVVIQPLGGDVILVQASDTLPESDIVKVVP